MKLKPKAWSHHHIQRLYHISMLAAFAFILAAIIFGFFAVLFQAEALTLTVQRDQGVTATVPGVTTATSTPENPPVLVGGGGNIPYITAPPLNPYITIQPLVGKPVQMGIEGKQQTVYVVDSSSPGFFGQTNILNANIFLEIYNGQFIRGLALADGDGKWQWQSPVRFAAGFYTIKATAQDQNNPGITASASIIFYVPPPGAGKAALPPTPPVLNKPPRGPEYNFNVYLSIPDEFKSIYAGQAVKARVSVFNFAPQDKPAPAALTFSVTDPDGKLVLENTETLPAGQNTRVLKPFFIHPTADPGKYTLTVALTRGNVSAYGSDGFEVKARPLVPLTGTTLVDYTVVFQALLALLFLFSLLTYFEYNKVVALSEYIKQVSEEDLKKYA